MHGNTIGVRWHSVQRCPLCARPSPPPLGKLEQTEYACCGCRIPIATGDEPLIAIHRCRNCDLTYKSRVPFPGDIGRIHSLGGNRAWQSSYTFKKELELIKRLFARPQGARILDVGAGQGGFLRAVTPICGSVSALDFMRFEEVRERVSGEFIEGLIEDRDLQWSGQPYDLVTLFDVLEHVYDADMAFSNLGQLAAPGGHVLIETGNPDSGRPERFGISRWWYLSYLEHHCAWSVKSIEWAAGRHGFEVLEVRPCRHKDRSKHGVASTAAALLRSSIYSISRDVHARLFSALGYGSLQPEPVFERDHVQVLLRRR